MPVVRDLYLYVMSLISVWVLAAGLAGLLALVIEGLATPPAVTLIAGERQPLGELSQTLALAVVALPLWTFHWWWIERHAPDGDHGFTTEERVFRGIYLGIVLIVATIVVLTSALEVLSGAFAGLFGAGPLGAPSGGDPLAWLVVGLAIWGYHARVLLRGGVLPRRRAPPTPEAVAE